MTTETDEFLGKLERFRFMMHTHIAKEVLDDIDFTVDDIDINLIPFCRWMHDQIAANITFYLLGQRLSDELTIKYPCDWWQAVKERFLPGWAKCKWPIRYTTIRMDIVALRRQLKNPEEYKVMARLFDTSSGAVDGISYDMGEGR